MIYQSKSPFFQASSELKLARRSCYNRRVEPWQPLQALQLTTWEGAYVFMAFTGAVTFYQSRRNGLMLRLIDTVLGVAVAFAVGQMAGFHTGLQAEEWFVVSIVAGVFAGVIGILCHAYIPGSREPWVKR